MEQEFKYFIPVRFHGTKKQYYFGTMDEKLAPEVLVVVETARGLELGTTCEELKAVDETTVFETPLKPVIRLATEFDQQEFQKNLVLAETAHQQCEQLIRQLNLDMNLISSEYTLDRSKILFVYVSEVRVDFRELLKELANLLHCRIELRQVGPRDKAKLVGGIGTCGMETCCSKYKQNFGVISINMAKNQMMALNIQKLSGQCGKLMCCLAYENDLYHLLKANTPKLNSYVKFQGERYRVTNINVLTQEARLENNDTTLILPFDTAFQEYREQQHEKAK